jgi:hypothetical protein
MAQPKLRKFRVLKDFKDLAGTDHKAGDEIEITQDEAQAAINRGELTAELGGPPEKPTP